MKVCVGEVDLERGNDLGHKKAEKKHGSGGNDGMMEFWNVGEVHRFQIHG